MLTETYQLELQTATEQVLLALLSEQFAVDSCNENNNTREIVSRNGGLATHDFHLEQVHIMRLAHEFNTTPSVVSLAIFGLIIHRYTPGSDSIGIVVGTHQLTILIRDCKFSTIIKSICLDGSDNISGFTCSTPSTTQSITVVERPLVLTINTKPGGGTKTIFDCQLVYFADYFDHQAAHGMCKAFQCLLKYLFSCTTFDLSYSELVTIPLVQSIRTIDGPSTVSVTTANSSNTIYAHFQTIANRYSDRICLQLSKSRSLTYGKCLTLVDQLSSVLQCQLGVTKSSVIGLWMSSSFEYVIALLATLKLGAVFVPLDIKHPGERLEFIEKQSRINVILTNNNNKSSTESDPIFSASKIEVNITNSGELEIGNSCINSCSSESQGELDNEGGYVIFTSGSSGKPKGVLIEESGLLNMALSQIRIFDVKPSDIVAQFASICFDASLSEILMTLLAGASLAIFRSPEERTGLRLIDSLNSLSITVITLPPSLLSAIDPEKLPCIRIVISAGEPCPTVLAHKWTDCYRRFFNAYGPSEAAVCATVYEYDFTTATQLAKYETLPIGAPIHNVRTRVVDSKLNDVPVGVPGELLLSGAGISRKGYIGTAKEKSNMAFVTLNQERWYRTGDLVTTMGPDHRMFIYLGRMDTQVKLRGCRIELNEIETTVLTCSGVSHCVVVLHRCEKCDDDLGALAAYVDGTATIDFIQEYITRKLPTYMLPTYIIVHSSSSLPTTLSGKIDRQLLAVDQNVHCSQITATPLTDAEQQMYMLWCQVLNKQYDKDMVLDVNDLTLAQCGGSSLTAALLQALLEKHFSINACLYAHMSLKQMANLLLQQADKIDDISYKAIIHDLNNDTIDLNDVVGDSHSRMSDRASSILLTGATGFLGCFLLNELLIKTSMTILVLVRARSLDAAKKRLYSTLIKYDLFNEVIEQAFDNNGQKRIEICLCGNLADGDESFSHLDMNNRWDHIDAVLHCAADTNFNMTYENLRQVNVQLTKYLLGHCVRHTIPFYHVSSLSIFLFTQDDITLPPPYISETNQPRLRSIMGGYSQSKYVADTLVLRALCGGLPGAIFRPGRVTGSSISGIGSTEDLFILMLRGCNQLRAYPKLNFPFDVTPVDLVSKAIVRIITRPQSSANSTPLIVHLINTKTIPFNDQFKLLSRFSCCTNQLEELSYNEWYKRLIDRVFAEQQQSNIFNPLLPLLPFLQSSFWQHVEQWPIFVRTNEKDAIMDMCPEMLFELYCRVWKRAGLFD